MSTLRQQLHTLRGHYAAERYPADLANQLLGESHDGAVHPRVLHRQPVSRWRLIIGGVGSAVAATIGLVVLLYEPAASVVQNSVSRMTQAAKLPFFDITGTTTAPPEQPFSIVPEFRSLDVSAPSDLSMGSVGATAAATREAA